MTTVMTTLPEGWKIEVRGPAGDERRAWVNLVSPSGKQWAAESGTQIAREVIQELESDARVQAVEDLLRDSSEDSGSTP